MYDVEESTGFELLPEGEYEACLKSAKKEISKGGNEYLSLAFEIRKDVPQNGQGRQIFDTVFKDKEKPEYFDRQKLGCIIATQPNHPKKFQSEDLAIQYINGINLRIKVTATDGSDGYEPKNKIKGKFGFKQSQAGKGPISVSGTAQTAPVGGNLQGLEVEDNPFISDDTELPI